MKFIIICYIVLSVFSSATANMSKITSGDDSEENIITQGEKVIMFVYYFLTLLLIIACFLFINSKV